VSSRWWRQREEERRGGRIGGNDSKSREKNEGARVRRERSKERMTGIIVGVQNKWGVVWEEED
jgi:hypothetical protein